MLKNKVIKIQRPQTLLPWAIYPENEEYGNVWIKMKPTKIVDQWSKSQGDIATEELNEEFVFLAPLNLNENIVHHWEAYESVASRIAQKIRSAVKLGAEGKALVGVFNKSGDLVDDLKTVLSKKGENAGTAVEQIVYKHYKNIPGSRIPKIKIDTPLYYTNSDRRQIVIEFQLFHENNISNDPLDVLVNPIQKLMKYSSPDLKPSSDIQIEFPYMWEVETLPTPFIKYKTCALIGVQPTWNSPYITKAGVPSSVNLQLTFLDMSPLYRETIESGSVINIISKDQADSRRAQEEKIVNANTQPTNISQFKKAGQAQSTRKNITWSPRK